MTGDTGVVARLDALEAAHKAATPGPWSATQDFIDQGVPDCTMTIHGGDGGYVGTVAQSYRGENSAAAIVPEHNAFPELIAAVRGVLDLADEMERDAQVYATYIEQLPTPVERASAAARAISHGGIASGLRSAVAAALGEA